jgi:Family of unknown function (DUF6226)
VLVEDAAPRPGPDRFGVLPEAAESLLEELTRRYAVERRETKEPLGRAPDPALVRVVRLVPRSPAAGPLAIVFTDPPGILLRLGRWYEEELSCAGDDPADVAAVLRARVLAHVEGGLWERIRRGVTGSWRETYLIGQGFRVGGSAQVEPGEARSARREGFAAPVQWAPWPRRP